MTDGQLYSTMLETLRASGDWMTFDELEQAIPWDKTRDETMTEPRRARLRGALGRAIHAGQIDRTKTGQAKYRISADFAETCDLFAGSMEDAT